MTDRRRWTIAALTMLAGAMAIVLALRSPDGLRSVTTVVALVAALTPLVLGLIVWARRPPVVALATSSIDQTDAAQRQLAVQVLSQWRTEIGVRRLDDPGPLPIRWRFTELDVVDRAARVSRTRFTGRAGEFRNLDRRRLVVLGDAGMGKTTLALLLLRELLQHAEPGEPVPVLLSMTDWDPSAEALPEWLARRLAEEYPALRATVFGPDAAHSLVRQRRILPILDGLDELAAEVRPAVLIRLNETAADPLVLTCRTAEYESAVTAPGGDALAGAAVIEPDPLMPADVAAYVTSCLPPGTGDTWQRLLASLRERPVWTALSTPLALWLLRKVYVDTRADPTELCDSSRFPTAEAILGHLLDHLVGAVITAGPPRRDDPRPRPSWDAADATRWLTALARHMTSLGSRDLAWWHLYRATARTVRVWRGIIAGLTLTLAVTLQEGLQQGFADGLVTGPVLGLAFGLVVGFASRFTVGHAVALIFSFSLLGPAATAGLLHGELLTGLAFLLAAAFVFGLVAVLSLRPAGCTPMDLPAYAELRLRGRVQLFGRKLFAVGEGGPVARLVPGFALGLVFGGVFGLVGDVPIGLLPGVLVGAVFGLAAWLAVAVTVWAETPMTDERPGTPVLTFRRDRRLVLVKSLTGGCALGVAFGLQEGLTGGNGPVTGLALGAVVAIAILLGVGLHQPSGRYVLAVAVLRIRGRIPLRLLRFLDDAHRLGILRQSGPVYQFRHAKLQDRLTRRPQAGS